MAFCFFPKCTSCLRAVIHPKGKKKKEKKKAQTGNKSPSSEDMEYTYIGGVTQPFSNMTKS